VSAARLLRLSDTKLVLAAARLLEGLAHTSAAATADASRAASRAAAVAQGDGEGDESEGAAGAFAAMARATAERLLAAAVDEGVTAMMLQRLRKFLAGNASSAAADGENSNDVATSVNTKDLLKRNLEVLF